MAGISALLSLAISEIAVSVHCQNRRYPEASMKKAFVAIGVCLGSVFNVFAQWTPTTPAAGATISYNGPVAVGKITTSTTYKLDVAGTTRLEDSVFLGNGPSNILYLWPDASGTSIRGTGSGIELVAGGGLIRLYNGNTSIEGWGTAGGTSALLVKGSTSTSALSAASFTNPAGWPLMLIRNDGNVGIGTASPAYPLDVTANVTLPVRISGNDNPGLAVAVSGTRMFSLGIPTMNGNFIAGSVVNDVAFRAEGGRFLFSTSPTGVTNDLTMSGGKVGIGTISPSDLLTVGVLGGTGNKLTVNGDVTVTGNLAAKYQDVAEWVPATETMLPGTVVILNRGKCNEVMASTHAYDTTVAGVVSATPGLLLGEPGNAKARIATTGRVKVRVDASSHPVTIGDILVTSDRSGTAMVSEPLDLGGVKIHRPGTIIGKALEPLIDGQGEILVLLSLQ
jgi:hypothetical protein